MKAPYQKWSIRGGGLLHSGLKSSFITFIPTNLVPIEQVNVNLSRRSIIQKNSLISKYFNSKCPVVNTLAAIFIPTKMATETWNFELKCFEIKEFFSA